MIVPTEINQDDIVKVLVNEDGIEDEMYGVVGMNTGESVMEHYPSGTTFADLEMKPLGTNKFAFYTEIDVEDSDSELYDEEETDSEMADFVVSDTEIEGQAIPLPPDHKSIDKEWNEWEPTTSGGKSFKETVDAIETRIRGLSV